MRRIFTLILIALSLLALWSCDIFGTEHTHEFGEWTVIKEATCTEDGSRTRSCSCGESETESVSATGHTEEILAAYPATCTEGGLTEGKKCTVCGEITQKQTTIPATGHTETVLAGNSATCTESGLTEGKKCTVCSETTVEQEEIVLLGHDYTYSEETDENGNITTLAVCQRPDCGTVVENLAGLYDSDCNLIASWDELVNVYGLSSNLESVLEENEELQVGTKLIVDDSFVYGSFKNCTTLEIIVLPKSFISLYGLDFEGCSSLTNITVDDENEKYKSVNGILYSKEFDSLFKYPTAKKGSEFIIPDSVSYIDALAFSDNLSLVSITIPNSVTRIGNYAFNDCVSLKNIYFNGTTEEWDAIKNIKKWLPNNVIANYDGKMEFLITTFIEDPSSSIGYYVKRILVENKNIYIDNELYIGTYINDFIIEYDEKLFSWATFWKDEEAKYLDVLNKIEQCEKIYMLEKTTNDGDISKIAVCFVDNAYYYLLFNEVDVNKVNYIYESHIELKK